jgi:PAS domain S-box-containing protein
MGTADSADWDGGPVSECGSGIDVLQVDGDPSFLRTARRRLESHRAFRVETETDPTAALDRLDSVDCDCIVSAYDLSEMDGVAFLEAVRERYPDLPFVLFPREGGEELATEALRAGASDYLGRDHEESFDRLADRIRSAVEGYRAEKRATAADHRVRRVYERIDDAFFAIDDEGQFTYVNRRAGELLDADPEELVGTTAREAFPEAVDSRFGRELGRAIDRGETVTFEEHYDSLDRWFEVRAFPDDSGLSVYFRDVTETRERQRRYDAVFNNTYQFTGLSEPDGTLIEANDTALEFVGADREAVVDTPLWETPWFQYNEETRRIARQSVEQAKAGTMYRDELPIEGADGETIIIDYSLRPVFDEQGEVTLLVPEGRDITDRKEREAELREERALTESIFSAMPDVLYVFDESGQLIRWNDQLSAVTGYGDEEIAEMHPLDFTPEDDQEAVEDAIDEILEEGRTVTVESALVTKDGERIPYEFAGARLTDDEYVLGIVGIGRDVSDRKRRERQLERQNERLEEFASLVSHDLKTPLSVASGNLQLARKTGEERYFDEVETALDRLDSLVDEVLELAKQGEMVDEPEPVALDPMLSNIETATGADIETRYPDGTAVMAEQSRLYSLLSNLTANAVEHGSTSPRSQTHGDAAERGSDASEADRGGDVTVEVGLDGETLYVADDGTGIPPEKREDVFEPGYSGDDGNGFGLAIVDAIAEAHGWTVEVAESDAGGARFEISGVDARSDG